MMRFTVFFGYLDVDYDQPEVGCFQLTAPTYVDAYTAAEEAMSDLSWMRRHAFNGAGSLGKYRLGGFLVRRTESLKEAKRLVTDSEGM